LKLISPQFSLLAEKQTVSWCVGGKTPQLQYLMFAIELRYFTHKFPVKNCSINKNTLLFINRCYSAIDRERLRRQSRTTNGKKELLNENLYAAMYTIAPMLAHIHSQYIFLFLFLTTFFISTFLSHFHHSLTYSFSHMTIFMYIFMLPKTCTHAEREKILFNPIKM
jgi:uncharacterized membrane protein YccF (DUF307 family)